MNDSEVKYRSLAKVALPDRQWPNREVAAAPIWASVDLRDGNQALPEPMDPVRKLEYFNMLLEVGFKEIEVAFPSASQDDFDFVRTLIEQDLIPGDVRISVLTQARKHLIDRTIESLKGVKKALIHCYVPTSDLHGQFVFGHDRAAVKLLAVEATRMIREGVAAAGMEGAIGYEFSPEEFTDTDQEFAIELCAAVKEAWGPADRNDFILNLPATVERRPPHHYADMIEYFCRKYPYLDETTVSIHAHNDQGCAVASSELAIMAGAVRVEGTLFGHGERTGNLDLLVMALNFQSRGIETGLNFSNLPQIVSLVESHTGIEVHPRHPYAGQLAFTAFSGSHQDAIRKGLDNKNRICEFFHQGWKMPYLHIDPADLGRQYERLIRINSQSGKGGVAYVLEKEFGLHPPKAMHPHIGTMVQKYLDEQGGEIDSKEVYRLFRSEFVNVASPFYMSDYSRITQASGDRLGVHFTWHREGGEPAGQELYGQGNGPLSAVVNALNSSDLVPKFTLVDFSEQTLGGDAHAKAMAFISIRSEDGTQQVYGAGEHSNIDRAALAALVSAINRMARQQQKK